MPHETTPEAAEPPEGHVRSTCKLGQGSECCRYLTAGPRGLGCAKLVDGMASLIDRRVASGAFVSLGDNCDGFPIGVVLR